MREGRAETAMHAERSFRLPRGYVEILEPLRAAIGPDAVRLDPTVERVQWQPGAVTVHTTDRKTFSARKLIVTLPLPILQQNLVTFEPALVEKTPALRGLRMGAVIKLGLHFDDAFWWTDDRKRLGFFQAPAQTFASYGTTYPVLAPERFAWCAGPIAGKLARLKAETILPHTLAH